MKKIDGTGNRGVPFGGLQKNAASCQFLVLHQYLN